jgi:DNA-binding GntR family transcriptional regulator
MTLAEYIRKDLRARILGGRVPPRLTLRDLAESYGVSFTPVRRAVEALVREDLLRRQGNRRLAAAAARPAARAATPPLPRDWTSTIARDVMRRSLRGEPVFLREEATAAELGIGRTLLRQVFGRLAGAGLLEHVPRRGWQVRPLREEDLDAYLEVREALELKALDLARPRLVRADLERILGQNRPSGRGGAWRVDSELHPYLIEKSGNRYLRDFFQRHGSYYTTLFYYAALGARAVEEMARQHRRILQDLLAGRWGSARRSLARHIRDQRPVLRRMRKRLAALPLGQWPDFAAASPAGFVG